MFEAADLSALRPSWIEGVDVTVQVPVHHVSDVAVFIVGAVVLHKLVG